MRLIQANHLPGPDRKNLEKDGVDPRLDATSEPQKQSGQTGNFAPSCSFVVSR